MNYTYYNSFFLYRHNIIMSNKNTMSPATGFAVGVGGGLATAAILNEANEAYEENNQS